MKNGNVNLGLLVILRLGKNFLRQREVWINSNLDL